MLLALLIAAPFVGSMLVATLPKDAQNTAAWIAGVVGLLCISVCIYLFPAIQLSHHNASALMFEIPWAPDLGLNIKLRMDGFAWFFTLIVSVIGTLVVLYARYYMSPADPVPRFFAFFLAFMGAMLGLLISGNLLQLVLFWELTSLVSFMLIAYWYHRSDARQGARMALTITGAGGLCLLVGVLLIGHIVGSYDLDTVLASKNTIREHPWYGFALAMVVLGALTKSAQFPFQFWLPNAMAAPTPVSAFLHSATMVKAGVFLLVRLWPVLSGTPEWFTLVGGAGLITLLLGSYASIFQTDLKGVLAYSTISHLGLITLLLGLNSELALVAAIFHIVNHATFKASLFMAAGIVDHETGTRDINRLSGLFKYMPITATLAMVAAAAMAGVPLLNGFISKEMFFAETLEFSHLGPWSQVIPITAVMAATFSVAYSLRFIMNVFFGPDTTSTLPQKPHEPPKWMLVPIGILVLICIAVGVLPDLFLGEMLRLAAQSILRERMPQVDLALWHGMNPALVMSMIATAAGIILYFALRRLQERKPGIVPFINRFNGYKSLGLIIEGLTVSAAWSIRLSSSNRLQTQLVCIMLATVLVAILPFRHYDYFQIPLINSKQQLHFALIWLAGGMACLIAAQQATYHRLSALIMVGVAGLATVLTFVLLAAPDLALTQLVVEVATLVLLLLGLRWLPRLQVPVVMSEMTHSVSEYIHRVRDFLLAILVGMALSVAAYVVMTKPKTQSISSFFIDKAIPEGGGTNVVNILLVDFRGFDTLGEITVLAIVALTVFALLRRFRPAPESLSGINQDTDLVPPEHDARHEFSSSVVLATLSRLWLPFAVMVSLYFLMRGHYLPGGGFIGGLALAIAMIVQYMLNGIHWVEYRRRISPMLWVSLGLTLSIISALSSLYLGKPFLTATTFDIHLPVIGTLSLSSVLFFDIGVFMLVVGTTVSILTALAHQSLRAQRQPVTKHTH